MTTIDDITTAASERFDMDTRAAESVAREYLAQIAVLDGEDYDEDDLPTEVAEFIIESIRRAQQDTTVTPLDRVAETREQVTAAQDTLTQARDERAAAILTAIDSGAPIRQIAMAAGVTRQTVYTIWDAR